MFGLRKSPISKIFKHNSVDPGFSGASRTNPFDSDTDSDKKQTLKPERRTTSEPTLVTPNLKINPFGDDDDDDRGNFSSSTKVSSRAKHEYKNDFRDSGGLENQSVQELEHYAGYKAEETTKAFNGCLKIAEDMREDASNTLVTLHHQGEQITRTHLMAPDMDQDLSRGEKLLGSLGGMFSRTWKPKKTRAITGPMITRDEPTKTRENSKEQREKLGLSPAPKPRSATRTAPSDQTNALQKVEVEKAKQDDALSDLSNILGDLKSMAIDMGTEIDKQNKALDHLDVDVDELNSRVRGANLRARRLLGK